MRRQKLDNRNKLLYELNNIENIILLTGFFYVGSIFN